MISTTNMQEQEFKLASADDDRQAHKDELKELFMKIAGEGNDKIEETEIERFTEDSKQNALQCAKICRVPVRDVTEVLKTLTIGGNCQVDIAEFVEKMVDISAPVTEKSIMKIMAKLEQIDTTQTKCLKQLETTAQWRSQEQEAQEQRDLKLKRMLEMLEESSEREVDAQRMLEMLEESSEREVDA